MKIFGRNLSVCSLICLGALLFIAGCKDKDSVAPRLYLNGDTLVTVSLNSRYIELGAYAIDNKDGDISSRITIDNQMDTMEVAGPFQDIWLPVGATIQVKPIGDEDPYVITYTVKDDAGNITVVTRKVKVVNDLYVYATIYSVTKQDQTAPYVIYPDYETDPLEFDENINNRLWFPQFSYLEYYKLKVYVNVVGDSIYLPRQEFPASIGYVFEGQGIDNFAGVLERIQYRFDLKYNSSNNTTNNEVIYEVFKKKI